MSRCLGRTARPRRAHRPSHEHSAVLQQCRGMDKVAGEHGPCRGPRLGGGVVQLGRGQHAIRVVATDHQHSSARQQGCGVPPPRLDHGAHGRPRPATRVVQLGGGKGWAIAADLAPRHQDRPIREKRGGVAPSDLRHGPGGAPGAGDRVVQFSGGEIEQTVELSAADGQHPAIGEERRRVPNPRLDHAAGDRPDPLARRVNQAGSDQDGAAHSQGKQQCNAEQEPRHRASRRRGPRGQPLIHVLGGERWTLAKGALNAGLVDHEVTSRFRSLRRVAMPRLACVRAALAEMPRIPAISSNGRSAA